MVDFIPLAKEGSDDCPGEVVQRRRQDSIRHLLELDTRERWSWAKTLFEKGRAGGGLNRYHFLPLDKWIEQEAPRAPEIAVTTATLTPASRLQLAETE